MDHPRREIHQSWQTREEKKNPSKQKRKNAVTYKAPKQSLTPFDNKKEDLVVGCAPPDEREAEFERKRRDSKQRGSYCDCEKRV